jgi:uncharacterized protein
VRVFPGATHIFDSFTGPYEFNDPRANRRKGATVRVRPDAEARRQARDDLVAFFTTALLAKRSVERILGRAPGRLLRFP